MFGRAGLALRIVAVAALALSALLPAQAAAQGWIVNGTVVDSTGVGIAGVDIDIYDVFGNELDLSQDFTGPTGTFSLIVLDIIPSGNYDIVYKSPIGSHYLDGLAAGIFIGPSVTVPTFAMESGWFVSGFVRSTSGLGLSEVDLDIFDAAGTLLATGGVTDLTGHYSVLLLPGTYDIEFEDTPLTPGGLHVPVLHEGVVLASDVTLPDVTLELGYPLSGTVHGPTGLPIVGADTDVRDPDTGVKIHTPGDDTGPGGVFSVIAPAGSWTLEVDPPLGMELVAQFVPVTVAASPVGTDVGIITLPSGVTVSGSVVGPTMAGVAGVDLDFITSSSGVEVPTAHDGSDGAGQFAVVVSPDTYDVEFKPPFASGLAPKVVTSVVVTGDTTLDTVLQAGPALTGLVTLSGAPLFDVEVTLADAATGAPVLTFADETDTSGHYAVRQVPGTYDVTFTAPAGLGLAPVVVPDVSLLSDTVLDLEFDSAPTPPPPVTALTCSATASDAQLTWSLGALDYDALEVRRNGTVIATLPGLTTSYSDPGLPDGIHGYLVIATRAGEDSAAVSCSVTIDVTPGSSPFIRGDANADGALDVADAVGILNFLFLPGSPPLPCQDAGDTNDSGSIDIADAVYLLGFLFSSGPDPLPPYPVAGADPTPDTLVCP